MRGEVNSDLVLKKYNPWSKRMTDLDKVLGQLMNVDLSYAPMDLGEKAIILFKIICVLHKIRYFCAVQRK